MYNFPTYCNHQHRIFFCPSFPVLHFFTILSDFVNTVNQVLSVGAAFSFVSFFLFPFFLRNKTPGITPPSGLTNIASKTVKIRLDYLQCKCSESLLKRKFQMIRCWTFANGELRRTYDLEIRPCDGSAFFIYEVNTPFCSFSIVARQTFYGVTFAARCHGLRT